MLIHGLDFRINWRKFMVGTSFFVPCLDADEALFQIERTTKRLRYRIKTLKVIEKGVCGLRIWRVR